MATQTVTIDRLPCSTTVKDVIRIVLGSDVPDLDQHVLFYVHGKREKRIKSTTHLNRLLARSKHRVHFVVKKRLKPKHQSSFGIKAKLLLQNMKSLFNEDNRNETKDNKDWFPELQALNAECMRKRLSVEADNLYQLDLFQYSKYGERDRSHRGRHYELNTLQSEFETRYADNESCHTESQQDKEIEDQSTMDHLLGSVEIERAWAYNLQHIIERECSRANNNVLKRTISKTIHPSKLYGVASPSSGKVPTKHKRQIGMNTTECHKVNTSNKRRKLDTTDQHIEFGGGEGTNYEHSITDSGQSGDYVLLKGYAGTFITNDEMVDEWDSAFEDDSDISV